MRKLLLASVLLMLAIFTGNRSMAQAYCIPTFTTGCYFGGTSTSGDQINNFYTTGGVANISNLNSGCAGAGALSYTYYSALTCSQIQGLPITLNMQSGAAYAQGFRVWIDWNIDGDFADIGEDVYNSASSTNLNTTSITVPLTATVGITRMRVMCIFAGTPLTGDYCATNITYGECEDYNFNIIGATPCSGTPVGGTASALPNNPCPGTQIALSLTGQSNLAGLAYQWLTSSSASGPWTPIPGGTTLTYAHTPAPGTSFYRCVVTCTSPGGGFDTSIVSSSVTVQTWSPTSNCYCVSSATSAFYEEITNVTMGTLNNTTDCLAPLTGTQGTGTGVARQFADFTASVPAPIVYIGLSQPFSVTIGNCDGFSFGSGTKIYIDYNHNSSFSDPGEEVYFSGLTAINSVPPTTLTGSFTPPVTALPGITRMRVINQNGGNATATTITPCNSYTYGETEDYLINLIPPQPFDPAVTAMTGPAGNCYSANQVITVQLRNFGSNLIDLSINPVTVTLIVNGPTGQQLYNSVASAGFLNPFGATAVTVPFIGVNMFAGGTYNLNTSLVIAGLTNGNLFNDSLQNALVRVNFRPTAGAPYQLCQFGSIPFGQGMQVSGCSTPIQDSVTITFALAPTTNPTATSPAGAALFASGVLPALPPGSTIGICDYRVTNLATTAGGWANETRFPIFYGPMPVQPANVLYASAQGNPATSTANYTWTNNVPPSVVGNMYNIVGNGGTINMGYHSTWGGNATINGYTLNAGGNPTVATLKIRYTYVPASFEWYATPTGGVSLYPFSPFNPLITTGSPLTNSNVPGTYTFYAACVGSSGCRVPVNLVINPIPAAIQDTFALCETAPGSNSAIFDLTTMNASVSNNVPGTSVEYYNDPWLFSQIANPTNDTSSTTFVYSKVSFASGCYSTDSLYLKVNSQPDFPTPIVSGFACSPASIDVASLINPFSTVPPGTDTLYYENPAFTIPHPNPHNITVADTVYMVFKTNETPHCTDSAIAYIQVVPQNNFISGQDVLFNYSIAGNQGCQNTILTDGNSDTLRSTVDCKRIAAVTDIPNLTSLGTVSICQDINASIPLHNGQPYLNRVYQLTATNNDSALVCLYYLNDDFDQYNAVALTSSPTWPLLPTNAVSPNIANIAVTKVTNGDLNTVGHIPTAVPNSVINASYDPASSVWTVCFPSNGFGYYYLHTANPSNIPLPVSLLNFTANKADGSSVLQWQTSTEINNSHFVVERSSNGQNFSPLSERIDSKAPNGNSQSLLTYGYTDVRPMPGHNYYRLQQHDIDGQISYSKVVDVFFGAVGTVKLYPNPVSNLLNIEVNTPKATVARVRITDATGRTIQVSDLQLAAGISNAQIDMHQLADGVYRVALSDGNGLEYSQLVRKH